MVGLGYLGSAFDQMRMGANMSLASTRRWVDFDQVWIGFSTRLASTQFGICPAALLERSRQTWCEVGAGATISGNKLRTTIAPDFAPAGQRARCEMLSTAWLLLEGRSGERQQQLIQQHRSIIARDGTNPTGGRTSINWLKQYMFVVGRGVT